MDNKEKLTSAKIDEKLYESFKIEGYKNKISYKQLIERSLKLYINDPEYRRKINNFR
jgi:hypothetical protein